MAAVVYPWEQHFELETKDGRRLTAVLRLKGEALHNVHGNHASPLWLAQQGDVELFEYVGERSYGHPLGIRRRNFSVRSLSFCLAEEPGPLRVRYQRPQNGEPRQYARQIPREQAEALLAWIPVATRTARIERAQIMKAARAERALELRNERRGEQAKSWRPSTSVRGRRSPFAARLELNGSELRAA